MLLNASGFINPNNIATALSIITKDYKPLTLPICVDFDSVYNSECASRFVPRSNVDNAVENTFYVTGIQQAIINQCKLTKLPQKGSFYTLLPCLSFVLENRNNYSNNLILEVINIGEHKLSEMVTAIKAIYVALGLSARSIDFIPLGDDEGIVEIWVNLICIGTISTFELPNGIPVTRATVIKEPIFSQAAKITI